MPGLTRTRLFLSATAPTGAILVHRDKLNLLTSGLEFLAFAHARIGSEILK